MSTVKPAKPAQSLVKSADMRRTRLPNPIATLAAFAVLAAAGALLPRWLVLQRFGQHIVPPEEAPEADIAIVFGAGLYRSGRPSAVLADRVATAVELFQSGQAQRLLMSGSMTSEGYDEPGAMRELAISLGVPAEAIVLDRDGVRTYATCWRARHLFGFDRALLVTQRYHLPRALVICDSLGLETTGVAADRRHYRAEMVWRLREVPATWVALWEAYVRPPDTQTLMSQPLDVYAQRSEGDASAIIR